MTLRLPHLAIIAAASLIAIPASAEPDEQETEAVEAEEEKAKEEKKICKRIATSAMSRRRTRVCMTRDEWQAYNEANRGRRH